MAEVIKTINPIKYADIRQYAPNTHFQVDSTTQVGGKDGDRALLVSFDEPGSEWQHKRILRAQVGCSLKYMTGGFRIGYASVRNLSGTFDENSVTWNNAPRRYAPWSTVLDNETVSDTTQFKDYLLPPTRYINDTLLSEFAKYAINNGIAVVSEALVGYGIQPFEAKSSALTPHLLVTIDDEIEVLSKVTAVNKTSGYVNPHTNQNFAWSFEKDGDYYCAGDWSQTSATFYWRQGTDGEWTAVAADGTNQNVTIPAETMQVGTVQWYVTATDDQGTTTSSPIYTINTEDSLQVATPISPNGTVEDGGSDILLKWTESNNTGTQPTGADLQISTDGNTWTDLAHISGTATTYIAPAGSFQGGTVYWRVRAYNSDGAAGPWSGAAMFVSMAAPPAPIVSAEAAPFATIVWQSDGQQAWRVTVNGALYGPYFGQEKRFVVPDYLRDGEHTAQVEVQGRFGIWSQPGEVTFSVENVPGEPVTLSGNFDRDAALSWETASQAADFLIYRDGMSIGHTSGMAFMDRTVLGGHSWQVINRLPSGNYTASNIVQGMLSTEELAIALLSGGGWLELTKSRNPTRQETYSLSQNVSLTHFAGQEYPEAEASPYKTLQGNFDVSWNRDEPEQAAAFEAMIGKPIIYKAPSGETLVGILAAIQKNPINFFKAYAATIQRIHWRDYVDADN